MGRSRRESGTTSQLISPFTALACPLDGAPLQRSGQAWRCAGGHSFDIARQGYTHLLPVQKKRSQDPGDSKEMVAARQRFLQAGLYQPIASAVSGTVIASLPQDTAASILDAGCGDGYYLRQLAAAVDQKPTLELIGLDISKWAILAAARQDKLSTWVVGSNANLPVQTGTLNCVLCMFGFPVYTEFARVLEPGGLLLQVDSGPNHLRELREVIYPALKAERPVATQTPDDFTVAGSRALRYQIELDDAALIADLLTMTPHLYRASPEGRARAAALTRLALTVDVRLSCFKRTH